VSQDDLVVILDRDYNIVPIGESIAANGFFTHEPLVAVIDKALAGEPTKLSSYTVVEGNRRLASIRLLTEPDLRQKVAHQTEWAELSRRSTHDLTSVNVAVYSDRKLVMAYLAQRHIAGVQKWAPLAKARFVAELIEQRGPKADLAEIARETASTLRTIRELYSTLMVIREAESSFKINTRLVRDNFTYLQRALNFYPNIAEYVGFERPRDRRGAERVERPPTNPIPGDKKAQLEEVITFLYGSTEPSVNPVVDDTREISKLAKVIGSPPALEKLRKTRDLEIASNYVGGDRVHLLRSINQLLNSIDGLRGELREYRDDPEVAEAIERLSHSVQALAAIETKPKQKGGS